jgi:trk system potassium uptake protein TrkA
MMKQKQQAIVVGLGQFGTSVARTLAARGVEVLVIDSVEARVQAVATHVAEAMCFDATDMEALAQTSPEKRDVCLCAIGDDGREASIICTALLRQAGAARVIARANDDVHARILRLVGAHQIVNPERAFGERFASQIVDARSVRVAIAWGAPAAQQVWRHGDRDSQESDWCGAPARGGNRAGVR